MSLLNVKKNMDRRKKERELAEKNLEKELGRTRYLERKAEEGRLGPGEDEELLTRLQTEGDRDTARVAKHERETLRKGLDAASGGTDDYAKMLAMQELGGMIAPGQTLARIQESLRNNGATDEQAKADASKLVDDAEKDVQEGVMRRCLNDRPEREKQRTSEVFDASTLAARFQSSVGGDDRKRELSYLESISKGIDTMAKAGVLNVRIKKT